MGREIWKGIVFFLAAIWLAGCTNAQENNHRKNSGFPPDIPQGFVVINDTKHKMEAGHFRWEIKKGFDTEIVQTDAASPGQIAERFDEIVVPPETEMGVDIEGEPQWTVYLWSENGREKQIPIHHDVLTAPSQAGHYIYEVFATWPDGEVSYTFVLKVD